MLKKEDLLPLEWRHYSEAIARHSDALPDRVKSLQNTVDMIVDRLRVNRTTIGGIMVVVIPKRLDGLILRDEDDCIIASAWQSADFAAAMILDAEGMIEDLRHSVIRK